jgi:uncharacterized protein (TIGR00661 family)
LIKRNNILICPLEWGLGHAARMIPMARKLRAMNQNVIVASGKEHLDFFREELPGLTYVRFPGFRPVYSLYFPQFVPLLLSVPYLIFHIIREHYKLIKILKEYKIDIIISDNRFGLWNRKIKCVYVTHMPLIPFPVPFRFLEYAGIWLHRQIINKYTFCFIPDLQEEPNFTGRLSHSLNLPANTRFIGILSRFPVDEKPVTELSGQHYNTVILSGPEPQKGVFRKLAADLFRDSGQNTVILEGKPGTGNIMTSEVNLVFINHMDSARMQNIISAADILVTRSGYSTIMDLASLGRSSLLVPTPGQTEQEYLALYLSSKGWFTACTQQKLGQGIEMKGGKTPDPRVINEKSAVLLHKALIELLDQ